MNKTADGLFSSLLDASWNAEDVRDVNYPIAAGY
jgi:hypothetical protein